MGYIQDDPKFILDREKRKQKLLAGLDIPRSMGVEIGALCRPFVTRDEGSVVYVDYTDTETLREKYATNPDVDPSRIVDVDAIWGSDSLLTALSGRQFDYVVASHVVEHVPDLITWLREVGSVLKPSGELRLIVPDKRFTFDYFRRTTEFSDVLLSYLARARIPQPHSLLDFCLNVVRGEQINPWKKRPRRDEVKPIHPWEACLNMACDATENGTYHDAHCWVFTPRSFATLMQEIMSTGLVDFACERFYDTEHGGGEFFVALRRSSDRAHIEKSWSTMSRIAVDVDPSERFWRLKRNLRRLMRTREALQSRPSGRPSPMDPAEPLISAQEFDPDAYLSANDDVRNAGADPFTHFKHYGWKEGRPLRPQRSSTPV